jgi:hypothetical protein
VGRVFGAVFTAENGRDLHGQAADDWSVASITNQRRGSCPGLALRLTFLIHPAGDQQVKAL